MAKRKQCWDTAQNMMKGRGATMFCKYTEPTDFIRALDLEIATKANIHSEYTTGMLIKSLWVDWALQLMK